MADVDLTDLTRSVTNGPQSRFNKVYNIDIERYAGFAQLEYTMGAFTVQTADAKIKGAKTEFTYRASRWLAAGQCRCFLH